MNFGMITVNQSTKTKQNYVTLTLTALLFILKLKIFIKTLPANDVQKWFDVSNYEEVDKRPLAIGKNQKMIDLFKDELAGKIMEEFGWLRAKSYAYLMDDDSEKKSKRIKEVRNKKKT